MSINISNLAKLLCIQTNAAELPKLLSAISASTAGKVQEILCIFILAVFEMVNFAFAGETMWKKNC